MIRGNSFFLEEDVVFDEAIKIFIKYVPNLKGKKTKGRIEFELNVTYLSSGISRITESKYFPAIFEISVHCKFCIYKV